MAPLFADRHQAGRQLADAIAELTGSQHLPDPIVLALPRGGVPVAAEVARALDAPLDVLVVRKIGAPGQPEVGIGAIVGEDPPLFDRRALQMLGITADELSTAVARERTELHRREDLYRHGRPALRTADRTVVLVDDGLATGVTARAAVRHLRGAQPARIVLAVPVCDAGAAAELRHDVEDLVCLQHPRPFHAVGLWYDDFDQVTDREVIDALAQQTTLR